MVVNKLQENELPLLFHYSSLEGWNNETVHTTALFHQHPQDFFILSQQDKLIGFIIAIKYSNSFGFISNLLILKEFRGLGYGKKLFEFALEHLQGCQIALDSVVGKEGIYQKLGFTSYFNLYIYRFIGGSFTLPESYLEVINFTQENSLKDKDDYTQEIILSKETQYKAIQNKENSFALSFAYADGYKIHIESEDINEALTLFFALTDMHKEGTAFYLQASTLTPMLEAIVELLKMQVDSTHTRMYNFLP